ncbi:MAG: hypothetical protein R6X27_18610 [Candidatus Desulfacyla sp.]
MLHLLGDASALCTQILRVLHEKSGDASLFPDRVSASPSASAVLLLLGRGPGRPGLSPEPCLIFNKRSIKVKQPGDLCFPGGRMAPGSDIYLSRILRLPLFPLARWPYWQHWRRLRPTEARRLSFLLAASLREALEEMRLNPLGVTFLGPLPRQKLEMFDRVIYPMAGWIGRQKRFFPNWEVEKIVHISIRDLLIPDGYGCYRLQMGPRPQNRPVAGQRQGTPPVTRDFPCFMHQKGNEREVLWGATYRITMLFLDLIFGFTPPPVKALPIIEGALDDAYITGPGRPQTA